MRKEILVSYSINDHSSAHHQLPLDATDFHVADLSQNLEKIAAHLQPLTSHGTIQILDISFPPHFMSFFHGPAFGGEELRKLLRVKEQPLSCFRISTAGERTVSTLLEQTYLGFLGGVDMILVPFQQENSLHHFLEHLELLLSEQKNCTLRTKKRTLLIPSIPSDSVREMQEYILSSQERGIRVVMVDAGKIGLTGLQQLRSFCSEIGVLLAVENWEKLCALNHGLRVSTTLMLKLLRMAGADIIHHLCHSRQVLRSLGEEGRSLLSHHDRILRHLRPAMPMIGPLQKIQDLESMVKAFGYGLILETHDVITCYPGGIKAGAEAFSAAIDAAFHGIDQSFVQSILSKPSL